MIDRDSMATLTTTISQLTVELAEANTKLVKSMANNNILGQYLANTRVNAGGGGHTGGGGGGGGGGNCNPRNQNTIHTHYC